MCSIVKNWPVVTEARADDSCLLCLSWVGFTKTPQQSDPEDARCPEPAGLLEPADAGYPAPEAEDDDGNRDPEKCRHMT